jgi:hypothetical protein
MKVLMMVKKISNKLLASGDRNLQITLEVANYEDIIKVNNILSSKNEVEITIPDN